MVVPVFDSVHKDVSGALPERITGLPRCDGVTTKSPRACRALPRRC